MKKFCLALFFVFTCFFPTHSLADVTPSIQHSWFKLENEQNYILLLELAFAEDTYTYSPTYDSYPTVFNTNFNYVLHYPHAEEQFDPISQTTLERFDNTVNYFLVFDSLSAETLSLSPKMLICTDTNCTPYSTILNIDIPQDFNTIQELNSSSFYEDFTQSLTLSVPASQIQTVSLQRNTENTNQTENQEFEFRIRYSTESIEITSLTFAIVLGFLAGFILNLMPCVLPVIAIKIASLVQMSNHDKAEQSKYIRIHGIFFSFGVLTFFTFLAIIIGGFDLIWGALFQQTYFIVVLSGVIFLLGLSFLNVFTLPLFNVRTPKVSSIHIDSFFQGLVISLIATPCSGPLLGGVLSFSLILPLHLVIIVFLATGLGMAFPYLLLAIFPSLIRFIPKSGNWTLVMEQVLAFILFATSIYLISLLPDEMTVAAIIYNFLVALFVWIFLFFKRSKRARWWAFFLFILHSSISYYFLSDMHDEPSLTWQNYSYQEFSDDLGNTPMLVQFTADWCPTCKVLEGSVLTHENIAPLAEEYGLELVQVDMTLPNEENESLLRSLDSVSIPLLAFFPRGIFAHSPIVLRDIYTLNQIKDVLETNF